MDRRSGDKFFLIRDEDCETCLPCDDASVWDSAVVQDTWVQPRSSESKKQLLHLGSKTSFYTAYPVANHLGLIAQLQKLHRRVIEFNFRITDLNSCFTTHESDFEAQQLETALDYFSRQLHPNVKAILSSHYLSRDLESNQIYWSMVYAQALLRYLYFFLYNSRYAGMDRYGIDTYANRHGPVVETLRVYAIKFTEVMDKFMAHNNFFMYTSPFMLTMVFDVGVLHLYAAKLCDWPEVAEENRGCLQKHIYALSGSSKFLSESERQALILVKGHQIDLSQISDDSKPGKLNADLQILFRQHT